MPKIKPLTEVENIPAFIQQVNSNFEKIEEALDNTVSRDGSIPNEMNAALDMNGQNIINIGGVSFVDGPSVITDAESVLFDTPVGWIAENVQEGIEEAYQRASDETTLVENSVTTLSGNAVRVDVAQSHSPSEQTQGRDNLGLGDMATKDDVAIADIDATGTADGTTFLRGDGTWQTLPKWKVIAQATPTGVSNVVFDVSGLSEILLNFTNISSSSSSDLLIEVEGATDGWVSRGLFGTNQAAANLINGSARLIGCNLPLTRTTIDLTSASGGGAASPPSIGGLTAVGCFIARWTVPQTISRIRLSWSAGNFDSGSVDLLGVE